MIDYSRVKDPEYLRTTLNDINELSDMRVLDDVLKSLSIKIHNGEITDVAVIEQIKNAVQNRVALLTSGGRIKRNNYSKYNGGVRDFDFDNSDEGRANEKPKTLSLGSNNTSISNRAGTVSIIFLVVNVTIIAAMYTLLILAHLMK